MQFPLVILGTNHPLQFGNSTCREATQFQAYTEFISNLCQSHQIRLIAKEASPEGLERHNATESLARNVARVHDINYIMIDLTSEEWVSLGLSDGQLSHIAMRLGTTSNLGPLRSRLSKLSSQAREAVWIARTLEAAKGPTLLIVGANHVKSLERLVRSMRLKVVIGHPDYEA